MMNKKDKLLLTAVLLLVLSTGLSLYSFLTKGKQVAPVILVYQGRDKNFQELGGQSPFWENYPYLVMLSQNRKIDSLTVVFDSLGNKCLLKDILKRKNQILFRYSFNSKQDLDTVLNLIQKAKTPVLLLADGALAHRVQSEYVTIYAMSTPLDIGIEKGNLSYFFSLGKDFKTNAIYVPRKEIPEVTLKYLEFMKTHISN